MNLKLITLLTILLFSYEAHSKTIANCGPSTGYSFFLEGTFVPKDKAGMQEDVLSSGKIKLELIDGEFRMITVDSTGDIKTVKGEGGEEISIQTGTGISVIAIYEGTFEHYLFRPLEGVVTWSSARAGAIIDKHSLFVSQCKFNLENLE